MIDRISYGSSKSAYPHGVDHIRVETNAFFTPAETESQLRLTTIAHILFPNSIPEPDSSWIDTEGKLNFVGEAIPHDDAHRAVQKLRQARYEGKVLGIEDRDRAFVALRDISTDPAYKSFVAACKDAGLNGYEFAPHNFIRHPNGNLIYIDFEPAFRTYEDPKTHNQESYLRCDPEKLAAAVLSLAGVHKEAALKAYRRLRDIAPMDIQGRFPEL
jgi:hypothetical protein